MTETPSTEVKAPCPTQSDPSCCVVASGSVTGEQDVSVVASGADLAALCKALAHPARVQIVRELSSKGTCMFGSLADSVPLARSTVAQHLAQLLASGLIRQWDDGANSCYCIVRDRLEAFKKAVGDLS